MQFYRRLFTVVSLFVFIQVSYGQELQNSIFWKISGNGLEKPSYIFGTHHLHDYTFVKNNQEIHSLIESTDVVIGELVIQGQTMNMLTKMLKAVRMKDKTVESFLTPDEAVLVDQSLKKNSGFGLKFYNQFKPSFLQQIIMVSKYVNSSDDSPMNVPIGNPMDGYFQEVGQKYGKTLKGLETIDQQLSLMFDNYSLEEQAKMLLETIQEEDDMDHTYFQELDKLYQEQNIEAIFKKTKALTPEVEFRKLTTDRNVQWIPQLEELFAAQKSAFIAVGAGHLPGDFGVLKLLMSKGYTVSPIPIRVE